MTNAYTPYRASAEVPIEVEPMDAQEKELRMTKTIAWSVSLTIVFCVGIWGSYEIVNRVVPILVVPPPPLAPELCHDSIRVTPWGTEARCPAGARLQATNLNNGSVVIGCTCGGEQ